MRGTLQDVFQAPVIVGIIPAHAGNTATQVAAATSYRDHPRACGEHPSSKWIWAASRGSSPRMRGTLKGSALARPNAGIIPAHAGNTQPAPAFHRPWRDHPRACGEHNSLADFSSKASGSSPRMRGTLVCARADLSRLGIIPAHAGNTLPEVLLKPAHGDHPRACGEHTSRLAQYRGFLILSVCFLFSFILSTSLLAGIYWRCSIRDEEHRQKTLPSHWMAV